MKKRRITNFIFSGDHPSFLVLLNKRKYKNMGNNISKINKDLFFACEEEMRNIIPFFKGKMRTGVENGIRGKPYTVTFAP